MDSQPNPAHRALARHIARQAWIDSDGDIEIATRLFRNDPQITKLDPMTIIALIQIALTLWDWWKRRTVREPSVVAASDEPLVEIDE